MAPRAGDVIRYDLTVTNTGGPAGVVRVSSELPAAYLIDFTDGCEGAIRDPETRQVVWYEGPLDTGATRTCSIRLLSPRDEAGTRVSVHTAISAFRPEAYWRYSAEAELDSIPDPHRVLVGPVFVSRAGLAVLALLALYVAGLAVLSALSGGGGRSNTPTARRAWALCLVCLGFLGMFGALARDDYRAATVYRETRCTVFDDAAVQSETPVRYLVEGVETYSSGFGTQTQLRRAATRATPTPARTSPSLAPDEFRKGTTHPCWYDPDDVKTVLLDRRPGAAYLFALIPLAVLFYAGAMLWGSVRRD